MVVEQIIVLNESSPRNCLLLNSILVFAVAQHKYFSTQDPRVLVLTKDKNSAVPFRPTKIQLFRIGEILWLWPCHGCFSTAPDSGLWFDYTMDDAVCVSPWPDLFLERLRKHWGNPHSLRYCSSLHVISWLPPPTSPPDVRSGPEHGDVMELMTWCRQS